SKFFSQLDRGEIEALARMAREQSFPAGGEIFKEGSPGNGMYVVKEGRVEISALVTNNNSRHIFSQVEPGEFFGEMAVLEDKVRSASAVAVQDTTVYFLPKPEVLELVERSPALALGLLREISNRLREFNRLHLREVLQAERLVIVGRFARSIVHDLKNPLNNIGLTAELAGLDQVDSETRQKAVTTIRQQVDRISEMISEILEFTQGPRPELVLPPVDYAQFARGVLEEIRPEASLKGVTLVLENDPPAVALLLHTKRLRRVFYNLIQNAAEAMPSGGQVRLRFKVDGAQVVTELEDTGPGIVPEMAGRLFEAFATHGKSHGTGLGLSICKRIVEDHHGWIATRREPGRGAIFAFGLPRPKP
ncbi:MAG: hypothetical protein EHM39_09035, partial [Chloroflexi bacterium]